MCLLPEKWSELELDSSVFGLGSGHVKKNIFIDFLQICYLNVPGVEIRSIQLGAKGK